MNFILAALSDTFTSKQCKLWADANECMHNPTFMWMKCESECKRVGAVRETYAKRCPFPKNATPALVGGQLDFIFDNIVRKYPELDPELVSNDPPTIVFNNFISHEKADDWIAQGTGNFERSTGLELAHDGSYESKTTPIRTSLNTWCNSQKCLQNPNVKFTEELISNITSFPITNFEYGQLLYYFSCDRKDESSKCSFYKTHGDFISADVYKNQGPRILTAFIYLNDVEEGGETVFQSGVSVKPEKGKMVLWSSVLNDNPHTENIKSHHEARPVFKGEKYAINFWLHQYSFREPHRIGCTM